MYDYPIMGPSERQAQQITVFMREKFVRFFKQLYLCLGLYRYNADGEQNPDIELRLE